MTDGMTNGQIPMTNGEAPPRAMGEIIVPSGLDVVKI